MTTIQGLVLALGLAACGGGSAQQVAADGGHADPSAFVNTWIVSTGTLSTSCPGSQITMTTVPANATNLVIRDFASNEVSGTYMDVEDSSAQCTLVLKVTTDTSATLATGECASTAGTFDDSTQSTLTLADNGAHLAADLEYTVTASDTQQTCSKHLQAVFAKF